MQNSGRPISAYPYEPTVHEPQCLLDLMLENLYYCCSNALLLYTDHQSSDVAVHLDSVPDGAYCLADGHPGVVRVLWRPQLTPEAQLTAPTLAVDPE